MDFFTPLGLDQEEQESDEEARRHRRELSRARRLSMQHQAEGKVEKSATPEAGAVPRRSKHSACQMGSLSSASSPGAASATKKRGSLLKRLSNAILTKAKREQSAAAQHSSPVERGAPPNDDLREGSPPRVAGPTATEAKAVPTETADTKKSPQDRNGSADLQ
ncbi:uncharacterized protein [Dermacentor albipictus]|uniref:uncharacterized protein isoform X4 n=1 Tax=Dermacentor albipictus TaxID=60249 RepID=UPI0031FDD959